MSMSESIYNIATSVAGVCLKSDWIKRRSLAPEIANSRQITNAIESYSDRFPVPENVDDPIFVFSAGWGSGSTLVQRLLISSGEVLVWGEPVDEAGPVIRLAQAIAPIRHDWPPNEHFRPGFSADELQGEWIANFAPEMFRYYEAHRQFFLSWMGVDAKRAGIQRWGLKEVRLTIDHARYLKWLFPRAKFIFIYRDLYGSYLSVRRRPWMSLWPEYKATPIISFAHHWKHLLTGFLEHYNEVDGVLVRYEDLSTGKTDLAALAEKLQLKSIDESLLNLNVGGRSARRRPLILPEKLLLDSVAGDLRRELGYS